MAYAFGSGLSLTGLLLLCGGLLFWLALRVNTHRQALDLTLAAFGPFLITGIGFLVIGYRRGRQRLAFLRDGRLAQAVVHAIGHEADEEGVPSPYFTELAFHDDQGPQRRDIAAVMTPGDSLQQALAAAAVRNRHDKPHNADARITDTDPLPDAGDPPRVEVLYLPSRTDLVMIPADEGLGLHLTPDRVTGGAVATACILAIPIATVACALWLLK